MASIVMGIYGTALVPLVRVLAVIVLVSGVSLGVVVCMREPWKRWHNVEEDRKRASQVVVYKPEEESGCESNKSGIRGQPWLCWR